jgi:uncharacterized protein (DUF1330 family)
MTREDQKQYHAKLTEAMQELTKHGYRCFIQPEDSDYLYGHVITPSDNVMYVQRDSYEWRGWTFSIQYQPSKNNGSGCGCLEDPTPDLSLATWQKAEREGLAFAARLRATLYKSSADWYKRLWNKEEMQEVK